MSATCHNAIEASHVRQNIKESDILVVKKEGKWNGAPQLWIQSQCAVLGSDAQPEFALRFPTR